uniref:BTB domain-containing protein n=1 Tax=Anopheles farauti TaxID=69004 RepID=A0A182Q8C0_9DIPT
MAAANTPVYHCIVCTLTKIPFASLSKESQQKIVRNGRPMTQMPNLTARCMNSLNLHIHDWLTGCDRERKLYCWPCLLFNTSEYDVWGKRGFSDFYRLASARTEHEHKDLSHLAKSKTLKLWIETAREQSDSSGEEDVECIPELDFLNMTASELDEELDVKPNVEALNASIGFPAGLGVTPVVDLSDTAEDGSGTVTHYPPAAAIVVDCEEMEENNSRASSGSAAAVEGRQKSVSPIDDLAKIYKKGSLEAAGTTVTTMSHSLQPGTEKYQLKWHSHYQNMNVSLSNLYKNDRYADVMLLTCNGDDSCTIPAHKLILGTSSLYFANIFDKNPVPLNAVTYIVLPPELTYRSMQILIQYMYTGESTVSTDILNEVLRGGEILRIRGLWRNESGPKSTPTSEASHPAGDGCTSSRFVSPVTVKLPVHGISHAPFVPSHHSKSSTGPLIQVKRDMAIDPADVRRPNAYSKQNPTDSSLHDHQPKEGERLQQVTRCATLSDVATAANHNAPIPQELNFLDVKAEPVEWSDVRADELPLAGNGASVHDAGNPDVSEKTILPKKVKPEDCRNTPRMEHSRPSSSSSSASRSSSSTEQPTYSPLTCELCFETFTVPGEWVRHIEGHSETSQTQPKRRRRAEESEETDETAALRCDLCATFFVTPADWVRHVQAAHTESELAACNKRASRRRGSSTSRHHSPNASVVGDGAQPEKHCTVCNKQFSSYASLVVHKRSHTAGEKPFYCELCNKGFNVKSNFVRHMRSVHNQPGYQPGSPHADQDSEDSG